MKRGASLDLSEISEDKTKVYPMDLARKNATLLETVTRLSRKIPYY